MQTDLIGYGDGMNWYAYVHGDPVNGSDPSGMDNAATIPAADLEEVVVTATQCDSACQDTNARQQALQNSTNASMFWQVPIFIGALPLPKTWVGLKVVGTQASKVTNVLGYTLNKLFRKASMGTVRILGTNSATALAGRVNILAATGLAAYDVTTAVLSIQLSDDQTLDDHLNEFMLDPFFN